MRSAPTESTSSSGMATSTATSGTCETSACRRRGTSRRGWSRTTTYNIFQQICHLIHTSPIGHRVVGARDLPLLGFSYDLE
jgi:hypothetical protein